MRIASLLLGLHLLARVVGAQTTAPLTVVLPDGRSTELSATALAALPRVSGQATARDRRWTWTGSDVREVLRLVGVRTDSLHGPDLRRVVSFVASDGYVVALALSDLDPSIGATRVILVDTEDGTPLPPNAAPRRIIVEGDRRPSRWARQVVRIVVSEAR